VVIPDSRSKQITIVEGGIAKLIDVETGYRTTSSVEITKGLKVGDSIIVSGMLYVRQGSNVKIIKTVKLADITK
jgi:membrane fusion protein (multidrug efflux system)